MALVEGRFQEGKEARSVLGNRRDVLLQRRR
jgi:hypothetical protein